MDRYSKQLTEWVKYEVDIEFAIDQLRKDSLKYKVKQNWHGGEKMDEAIPADWVAIFIPEA